MITFSTATIKKGGDLKQTARLAAADLVLPQPVPLCLKFSSDGEKREFAMYGILGTIASFMSPYQLIKYLINYPIRNLIALLLNLITNQLRPTIDK
jgi:hypothetical protein